MDEMGESSVVGKVQWMYFGRNKLHGENYVLAKRIIRKKSKAVKFRGKVLILFRK